MAGERQELTHRAGRANHGTDADRGPTEDKPGYILAAGGLLERPGGEGVEVAVVHRRRYADRDGSPGDWVLPKGKREPSERLEDTALREVEEETGWRGRILRPGVPCEYLAEGVPKVVMFFPMEAIGKGGVRDASEVAEVAWLSPRKALERLTYPTEREVLRQLHPELATGRDVEQSQ
jgi:8-oxo-dGTP diphosphatase